MPALQLQHFYISEQQSLYLLKADDANKHKAWFQLCEQQLAQLGYQDIQLIGQGTYGFVYAGIDDNNQSHVFKFSRITLTKRIQDRLEEEAYMLSQITHNNVPSLIQFKRINKQNILVMERAKGEDLEQVSLKKGALSPQTIMLIAKQLSDILLYLRQLKKPVVHGDIKPSNLVWNEQKQHLDLIDWGSAVFAQTDKQGEMLVNHPMGLIGEQQVQTNARMGDVYFIGKEQFSGELSSPRFDEQGVAATLYCLASAQACRFGITVIPATSLGLPKEFARVLNNMLSDDPLLRKAAGDYFIKMMSATFMPHLPNLPAKTPSSLIPFYNQPTTKAIETVCYSSRKSFLQEYNNSQSSLNINDLQFEKYSRNFLADMGNTEKAFIIAVERLGQYPIMGGISFNWRSNKLYIDSNLCLFDLSFKLGLTQTINNMVILAQGIHKSGTFKACFFNAKNTLHIERPNNKNPFVAADTQQLLFDTNELPVNADKSELHSYFEDGPDPDENLVLPSEIITELWRLNDIHHAGCIIFEVLPHHMKIHSYLKLLNPRKQSAFRAGLDRILQHVNKIQGVGVSGFMKLPHKNTREFCLINSLPAHFYPKNPKM